MNCPRCSSELIIVEAEGVELDWCSECGGVWFDEGEVEALLGRRQPISELFTAPEAGQDPSCRCPRCSKKLLKVGLKQTVLDQCPAGHGLWFDRGELAALREAAQTEPARKVVEHLIETFGGTGSGAAGEGTGRSGRDDGKKEDSEQ